MDKKTMGERIKEARRLRGMTQEALAELANIGPSYLCDIERGVKFLSLGLFIVIVEKLEVSADYILRGEISAGKHVVYDNLTDKLEPLTPKQRECVAEMIDTYVKYL